MTFCQRCDRCTDSRDSRTVAFGICKGCDDVREQRELAAFGPRSFGRRAPALRRVNTKGANLPRKAGD